MERAKNLVRQHWERRAADFDNEASHALLNDTQARAWRQLILRLAGPTPLDALDVGCGTGFLSLLLAAQGHRVTAIDIAEAMLARARAKASTLGLAVDFRHDDAEAPGLPQGSFDLIVERHLVWTLPAPGTALDNWRRLLRAGGRVVLIEGHWPAMEPRDEYAGMYRDLPLFGGRPEKDMTELIGARAFSRVTSEPLMEAELWTEIPSHPRYLITAWA